jgi:hypothetical protein
MSYARRFPLETRSAFLRVGAATAAGLPQGLLEITPAAGASPAAAPPVGATAAATATAESRALWTGFIHRKPTPLQGLSVKSLDRTLHVFFVGQFDEAKASGFTRHLIANHHCGNDLKPSVNHEFTEHTVSHSAGKVPHE